MTCLDRDTTEAQLQAGEDKKKLRMLMDKIKTHKYIGKTNRSIFERSWEHINDYENLSIKSHMLKHAVEMHAQEDPKALKFGMKAIKFTKSSFERQVLESVEIQNNRHHHLLNSRSEFNRCAVPRMMCKLGDKTFKKNKQEIESDMAREEAQVSKIRELIKERNKKRGQAQRPSKTAPAPKRRKLEDDVYEARQEQTRIEEGKTKENRRQTTSVEQSHQAKN